MSEVIRVRGQYYILASSALADSPTRVLKQGETFAIFDPHGDVRRVGRGEQGIYHKGTRHLSRSTLRIGKERPLLLGSSVTEDNSVLAVDLTNPDMTIGDADVQRGELHIFRSIFLWRGCCYQRLRVFNYADRALDVVLSIGFEADFADIFEVRGVKRERRGVLHDARSKEGQVLITYDGLDGVERRTKVTPSPGRVEGSEVAFSLSLEPHAQQELYVTVGCEGGDAARTPENYASAMLHRRQGQMDVSAGQVRVRTSNELFNAWMDRSLADLRMMITPTEHGPFPYAGVPWFSAPFGRDAIITAYELLWLDPSVANGVLRYLAATQARDVDPEREAEPGKVIHERRSGELAALGEVPFGSYYGSVDATPLFIALAGEYFSFTHDTELVKEIWPNIQAALTWIDDYGDTDGDGFVEYRGSEKGLIQQGWKDSHDAVFHADGREAPPPIALCEVQGYVYWAKRKAAEMAEALGLDDQAEDLSKQAQTLREAFESVFWVPDIGSYALALDGEKKPCALRASNAGHCLTSGIAGEEHAESVAHMLMSDTFFSGWGVRTLASTEARYGPITYHNGSVWPHDNALIADGLARYGFKDSAQRIMSSMLDASEVFEFQRLPELFSGFSRRPGQGPIGYPLACAPQAWAAGAVFLFLKACLGLSVDAQRRQVVFTRPLLPPYLREVHFDGLHAGDATVDVSLYYHQADDVGVNVTGRTGDVEVVVVK